jgi:ribonuclease HI
MVTDLGGQQLAKKGGIKNLDIVQPLYNKYNKLYHQLIWTRGHAGTELNELADNWANQARRRHLRGVQPVNVLRREAI